MKLSANEAKLTGLWARNCATFQQVLSLKFTLELEKFPGFRETGPMDSYLSVRGSERAYNRVGLISQGAYNRNRKMRIETRWSIKVSGKLPTYPSPKSTLTLTSHLGQNIGLGEG